MNRYIVKFTVNNSDIEEQDDVTFLEIYTRGNVHSYTCMSQTSKSRINALLPYGSITQKKCKNFFGDTELLCGCWYKLINSENIVRLEGLPCGLVN